MPTAHTAIDTLSLHDALPISAVREVVNHLWHTYSSSHRVKFISVPFEGVVAEMQRTVPDGLIGVVLKRMMVRAASRRSEERRVGKSVDMGGCRMLTKKERGTL